MNIKEDETGFFNNPLYTGQRPERILNNDDFPQPLGPVIKTCCPEKRPNISEMQKFHVVT